MGGNGRSYRLTSSLQSSAVKSRNFSFYWPTATACSHPLLQEQLPAVTRLSLASHFTEKLNAHWERRCALHAFVQYWSITLTFPRIWGTLLQARTPYGICAETWWGKQLNACS